MDKFLTQIHNFINDSYDNFERANHQGKFRYSMDYAQLQAAKDFRDFILVQLNEARKMSKVRKKVKK